MPSPSLLVLCGDHGMAERGGHGASSVEEVNTALLLVSSAFERKPGERLGTIDMLELCFISALCNSILTLYLEAKFQTS